MEGEFNLIIMLHILPRLLLFSFEHFKQAVLANMKGAGKIPFLDYDPSQDSQSLDVFERDKGKVLMEMLLMDKAPPWETREIDDSPEHGTLVDAC